MPVDTQFQFALGQHVRWAGEPTQPYQIRQRRWTERAIGGPVVEYYLPWRGPHGPDVGWVYEADLTCWPDREPRENMMPASHGYTCPCGLRHAFTGRVTLRRRWGTLVYAPWFQHTCSCGRVNTVHAGEALMSIPQRRRTPAQEATS